MSEIEISSGLETVITPVFHYRFHWMGDHWKQEIECVGGCQAIPHIWSIEEQISRDSPLRQASPAFQVLTIKKTPNGDAVARLSGRSGPHQYTATIRFEELADEVVIEVEVNDLCSDPAELLAATYLIQSSNGHLQKGESASITWPNPETKLIFEAEQPSRIEADEAGMGTIRLKAVAKLDSATQNHTLRYRWRWITTPGHQIWDRDV